MIIADTSALVAALDRSERAHEAVRGFLGEPMENIVVSPFVLAETDYLLRARLGIAAPLALLDDVIEGAYELAGFDTSDLVVARGIVSQYGDFQLSLADASIICLAERYETTRVLTLDERHFRAVMTLRGEPFEILPADA